MLDGNRIRERVDSAEFIGRLKAYGRDNVTCTSHAFFRLSRKQRKIFTCESIRDILFNEVPVLVGLQENGCHAAFYKHKSHRIIRIILDMKADGVSVVTFYVIEERQLPVIK